MFVPHRKHIRVPTACYGDTFTFFYVDDVCTSQEAHIRGSMACYGDNFFLLYVDDIRTTQETHMWASTVCCRAVLSYIPIHN
jgi:hypothetical protein